MQEASKRLIRKPEVLHLVGFAHSSLYRAMEKEGFPQPVKIGARSVAWRENEVIEWIDSRNKKGASQ